MGDTLQGKIDLHRRVVDKNNSKSAIHHGNTALSSSRVRVVPRRFHFRSGPARCTMKSHSWTRRKAARTVDGYLLVSDRSCDTCPP